MIRAEAEQLIGRTLAGIRTFESEETFGAYEAALRLCQELGYSVGRMCNPEPTGIKRGVWDIQKWRNLSRDDRRELDGLITGNFRDGPVTLFFEGAPLEQLADCAENTHYLLRPRKI